MVAIGGHGQLLAQFADEDVDDLQFGFVHAAIQVVEEHFLGERRALAQAQQLEHFVFLAGQVDAVAGHFDGLGIQIDDDVAGADDRLGVALGAADHGVDARDQFVLVERLGHVVIGAAAERLDLGVDFGGARQDHHRRVDLADAQLTQDFETGHVGQAEVKQDQVVIVDLAEVDTFFAEVGRIDVKAFRLEHQLDALRGGAIVFNQ